MTPSDVAALGDKLSGQLDLAWAPVGVHLILNGGQSRFPDARPLSGLRYCQAVMLARRGEAVRLAPGAVSCPAAAAAFGFRELPDGLASGQGLVGFGIAGDAAVGRTMFEGMARLEPGRLAAIELAPLAAFADLPDVVVVEDRVERLMWLLLAYVNLNGGARVRTDTAVLQATCVDATLAPFVENRLNFSYGCYGCREATDIEPAEAVLGFPGALLPALATEVERLAGKAIPRSRAKATYGAFDRTGEGLCPFGPLRAEGRA